MGLVYYNDMKQENVLTRKQFSLVKRAKSFEDAGRGVRIFLRSTPNAWIQIALLVIAIMLGAYFEISQTEWVFLVFAGGFVLAAEAFNTAIEIDIDLTSPQYHPFARDIKDVAAGAVLIAATTALIVGILVLGPYLLNV